MFQKKKKKRIYFGKRKKEAKNILSEGTKRMQIEQIFKFFIFFKLENYLNLMFELYNLAIRFYDDGMECQKL